MYSRYMDVFVCILAHTVYCFEERLVKKDLQKLHSKWGAKHRSKTGHHDLCFRLYVYIYTLHNLKCVSESLYNGRRLPPSWLSVRLACPIIQLNLTLSNLIRVFSSPSKGIKKKQRAWKIKDHCKVQPVVYILCQNHKHEEFKSQSSPVSLNPLPHTMGTHSSILGWLA